MASKIGPHVIASCSLHLRVLPLNESSNLLRELVMGYFGKSIDSIDTKVLENPSTDTPFSILVVCINKWKSRFLWLNAAKNNDHIKK